MGLLVIQTEDKSSSKLLLALAKKLGSKAKLLNKEESEDFVFGQFIHEEKTGENTSRDEIMRKLEE